MIRVTRRTDVLQGISRVYLPGGNGSSNRRKMPTKVGIDRDEYEERYRLAPGDQAGDDHQRPHHSQDQIHPKLEHRGHEGGERLTRRRLHPGHPVLPTGTALRRAAGPVGVLRRVPFRLDELRRAGVLLRGGLVRVVALLLRVTGKALAVGGGNETHEVFKGPLPRLAGLVAAVADDDLAGVEVGGDIRVGAVAVD